MKKYFFLALEYALHISIRLHILRPVILNKNNSIPCSVVKIFGSRHCYQLENTFGRKNNTFNMVFLSVVNTLDSQHVVKPRMSKRNQRNEMIKKEQVKRCNKITFYVYIIYVFPHSCKKPNQKINLSSKHTLSKYNIYFDRSILQERGKHETF